MSVRVSACSRASFFLGLAAGLTACAVISSAQAEPVQPVHVLAQQAWPYMNAEQQALVDVIARDLYEKDLSPTQKARISGSSTGRYDALPDWRKAPFRGTALRQLGHRASDFTQAAI